MVWLIKIVTCSFILWSNYCVAWTTLYSIAPVKQVQAEWSWSKLNTPHYTQLLFSWNAYRPTKGHFTFWVRARSKKYKKWCSWHKMASWGKGIQKSYLSKNSYGIEYIHVRLEVPCCIQADGFSVKITAHKGASLKDIKSVSANIVDLKKFKSEAKDKTLSMLPSVIIKGIPKISQMELEHPKFDALCSPTSLAMTLSFLFNSNINTCKIAEAVYDNGLNAYGSWPFNTASAFEMAHGKAHFQVVRLPSFKVLYDQLKKSIPVIVSIRGPLEGSATPYAHGHLLVVIGYDNKKNRVICHDPAFDTRDKVYTEYDLEGFLTAWERSRRLAYKIVPLENSMSNKLVKKRLEEKK